MGHNPKCSVTASVAVRAWLQQNKCCLAFTPEALTSLQGISPAKASIKIGRGETKDEVVDPNRDLDQDQIHIGIGIGIRVEIRIWIRVLQSLLLTRQIIFLKLLILASEVIYITPSQKEIPEIKGSRNS